MILFIGKARRCKLFHSDRKHNCCLGMAVEAGSDGRDGMEHEGSFGG